MIYRETLLSMEDQLIRREHSPCQAPQLSGSQRSAACQRGLGCWVYLWLRRSVDARPAAGLHVYYAGGSGGYLSGEGPQWAPLCCAGPVGWCLASSLVERRGSAAELGSELQEGRKRQGCQNPKEGPRRRKRLLPPTQHRGVRREGRPCRTRQSHVGKQRSVGAVAGKTASGHGPTLPCSQGHYGWFWISRALTRMPSCRPPPLLGLLCPVPLDSAHYYPDPSETSSFTVRFYLRVKGASYAPSTPPSERLLESRGSRGMALSWAFWVGMHLWLGSMSCLSTTKGK